jgi:alanine racemase
MKKLPLTPLALQLDSAALKANWTWLNEQSGAASCGAAIKANGYGLGAVKVMKHLMDVGCQDFFVASWAEAAEVMPYLDGANLSVLHGVREEDMEFALHSPARPVLSTPAQINRWKEANGGPCDIMIDTGMNRLGLDPNDFDTTLFQGLEVDICMSHLACADDPGHQLNMVQPMVFKQMSRKVGAKRLSLANSAGIMLGEKFCYDITRPGLALYGGIQGSGGTGHIQQVVTPRAQILQRRTVRGGESVGYGATYTADKTREAAILNLGYADGYYRCFSGMGAAKHGDLLLSVLGRVSMDLVTVDVTDAPELKEGDWVDMDFDLPMSSAFSGMTQYELLTGLGRRLARNWI